MKKLAALAASGILSLSAAVFAASPAASPSSAKATPAPSANATSGQNTASTAEPEARGEEVDAPSPPERFQTPGREAGRGPRFFEAVISFPPGPRLDDREPGFFFRELGEVSACEASGSAWDRRWFRAAGP